MRLYELIHRLEAIRDRMESTFTNEFLKGEVDNLIDELKKLSPEIGKLIDTKDDEELLKKLKENYPLNPIPSQPFTCPNGTYPSTWTTSSSDSTVITSIDNYESFACSSSPFCISN